MKMKHGVQHVEYQPIASPHIFRLSTMFLHIIVRQITTRLIQKYKTYIHLTVGKQYQEISRQFESTLQDISRQFESTLQKHK